MGIRGFAPGAHIFCAPHGGAVAPQRRKIRYPRQAKPAGDFGRPMRAAIPMLGTLESSESTGFSNVSHFAGQNGTVIRRPRWGRGRARCAGRAEPAHEGWFALGGTPRLSRRYWGLRPLAPWASARQCRERSEAMHGRRCNELIHRRDDHLRHAETRKRQHLPTTRTKAVFSLESEGFLFDKTKRNPSGKSWVDLVK